MATARPSRSPAPSAPIAIPVLPGAPLTMLAPVCGDAGQAITWAWTPAPDAAGYVLQVSTSGATLPNGTLRQPDTFNNQLDAGANVYTTAAAPGQPYYAVVLPLLPSGEADATRVSRLTEAACVDPGTGSRPLPAAPAVAPPASAAPSAAPPLEPPAAPDNLTATPLDSSEVRLDWNSNSTDEDGFAVDDGYSEVAQVPAGVTTITLVGLDPNGPYCAAVYAFNRAGASDLSNFVCFTTLQTSDDGGASSAVVGRRPSAEGIDNHGG